jgi:hypothetical protein
MSSQLRRSAAALEYRRSHYLSKYKAAFLIWSRLQAARRRLWAYLRRYQPSPNRASFRAIVFDR